jgi:hypothetical protein
MRAANQKGRFSAGSYLLWITLFVVQAVAPSPLALARATQSSPTRCAKNQSITANSLLVILLDRSGSLIARPGATDPEGYSTSVTRALADLWPGMMAVITFGNDRTPTWGPYRLADPGQRALLKNAIQQSSPGGDTPLAPALLAAFTLFQHASGGSRMVIVTDGSPEPETFAGIDQISEIEHLLPGICSLGIPVSTVGLTLNLARPDGQIANKLLADIAARTGGGYVQVQSAARLAQVVMTFFSQWLHLVFAPVQFSAGRYTVAIDAYVRRVIFAAFRSKETSAIILRGPTAQSLPAQAVQRSIDRHYEIDSLRISAVNQPGLYSIDMSGDPGAQVYALVETGLHAVLLKPSAGTIAYIGQPLTFEAQLLNGITPVIPRPDEAILTVDIHILAQGRTTFQAIIELVQRGDSSLFSRQLILPGPAGQVYLQVVASYLQVPVEASSTQLSIALQSLSAGGHICSGQTSCTWLFSPITAVGGISALFLLLGFFLFLLARKPGDWLLSQGGLAQDLGDIHRPLWRSIFFRSTLSSRELENQFDFCGTQFLLLFKRELHLLVIDNEKEVNIQRGTRILPVKEGEGSTEIEDGDVLLVETCPPVIFKQNV